MHEILREQGGSPEAALWQAYLEVKVIPKLEIAGYTFDVLTGPSGEGVAFSAFLRNEVKRVPKGHKYWDIIKKRVAKGGEFMRKKLNGYLRFPNKGDKFDVPTKTHTTKPYKKDTTMDDFVEWTKRYLNGRDGPDLPGGG